jgi:hypothetical protein
MQVRYGACIWVFLRLMGMIYLTAFLSSLYQYPALIGKNGVSPVDHYIMQLNSTITIENNYFTHPTLFWFNQSNQFIAFHCALGIISSIFLIFNLLPGVAAVLCWILYLSISIGGQNFYEKNNNDNLLLESGFLLIFVTFNVNFLNLSIFNYFQMKKPKSFSTIQSIFNLLLLRIFFLPILRNVFFNSEAQWRLLSFLPIQLQTQFSPSIFSLYVYFIFTSSFFIQINH